MKLEFRTTIKFVGIGFFLFWLTAENVCAQKTQKKRLEKRPFKTTLTNFNADGQQTIRFDNLGEALDAHDGEIAVFNGVYYLYGTSYGCGFEWGKKDAPFCGFKVYSSTDMVSWTDRGFLFDASTPVWQSRCNGSTYGCFRPHVVFNKRTSKYVLWINVYDNRVGFRVFTSSSPTGPFKEVEEPKLAVNSNSPVAGLNNGDHDTFVDSDGKGYIAYTDWRTNGTIVIEELTSDYLSGSGRHVKAVTGGNTEAPSLFKRKGIYYVTYSDPNCGYCSGTGTSYKTAKSPLGPWSEGIKISYNSCGGQPSFVSPIELTSGYIYLYGSDLWNNAAKNEALANYYWAPMNFSEDGSIMPMICQNNIVLDLASGSSEGRLKGKGLDFDAGSTGFLRHCDIKGNLWRSQSFIAGKDSELSLVAITVFKTGYPNADLTIELYKTDTSGFPVDEALKRFRIPVEKVSWSPNQIKVFPNVILEKGQQYAVLLKSSATEGCYGFAYKDLPAAKDGVAAISTNGGKQYRSEPGRILKLHTFLR